LGGTPAALFLQFRALFPFGTFWNEVKTSWFNPNKENLDGYSSRRHSLDTCSACPPWWAKTFGVRHSIQSRSRASSAAVAPSITPSRAYPNDGSRQRVSDACQASAASITRAAASTGIGGNGTSQAHKKVTILCSTRSGTLLERESDHRFNLKKESKYEYQPIKRLVSIPPCPLLQGEDAVASPCLPAQ
jgi:hypothetical protein